MVSRPVNSGHPYLDVRNAARFAPPHRACVAASAGYRHLLERLAAGERPAPEHLEASRAAAEEAWSPARSKVTVEEREILAGLRDQVLVRLD